MNRAYLFLTFTFLTTNILLAQEKTGSYSNKNWKDIATKMPSEWYASDEAKLVAENVILAQKEIGGWEKNKPYHQTFSVKTQIIVDNKLTVWCAQHDEITLAPAKARSYELPSFSGSESVGITLLLMRIDNPSTDIIEAVNGAVKWFENNKIEGIKLVSEIDKNGKKNRIVVEDKTASPLWGRFYDLKTNKPFFCSRDGIKRNALAKISHERRNGYSWYTSSPEKVLEEYPKWLVKNKLSVKK